VTQGRPFEFAPYDYGPLEQAVYNEAERLSYHGDVEITRKQGASD
jgi:hypothetical protein